MTRRICRNCGNIHNFYATMEVLRDIRAQRTDIELCILDEEGNVEGYEETLSYGDIENDEWVESEDDLDTISDLKCVDCQCEEIEELTEEDWVNREEWYLREDVFLPFNSIPLTSSVKEQTIFEGEEYE